MIYQSQLYLYQQLREADRRRDALRQELVASLTNGSRIEAGPLTAFLRESTSQRLSWPIRRGAVGHVRPSTISECAVAVHGVASDCSSMPAAQWPPQSIQTSQPFRIRSPNYRFDDEWRG